MFRLRVEDHEKHSHKGRLNETTKVHTDGILKTMRSKGNRQTEHSKSKHRAEHISLLKLTHSHRRLHVP